MTNNKTFCLRQIQQRYTIGACHLIPLILLTKWGMVVLDQLNRRGAPKISSHSSTAHHTIPASNTYSTCHSQPTYLIHNAPLPLCFLLSFSAALFLGALHVLPFLDLTTFSITAFFSVQGSPSQPLYSSSPPRRPQSPMSSPPYTESLSPSPQISSDFDLASPTFPVSLDQFRTSLDQARQVFTNSHRRANRVFTPATASPSLTSRHI